MTITTNDVEIRIARLADLELLLAWRGLFPANATRSDNVISWSATHVQAAMAATMNLVI